MATKKAAVKKAVKKAPAKKTTAKKLAPKKRTYTRKKVEETPVAVEEPMTANAVDPDTNTTGPDDSMADICSLINNIFQRPAVTLQDVEFIDLRDTPAKVRLVLLAELTDMGYVPLGTTSLENNSYFASEILSAEVLKLVHDNKLMFIDSHSRSDFLNSTKISSINGVRCNVQFFLSELHDAKPELIEKDGVKYVRVS